MVASQLLHSSKSPPPTTGAGSSIVEDVRTPPKLKNQQANKNKPKVSSTTTLKPQIVENSHAGIALPMTAEDLDREISTKKPKITSTTEEGISTWILLSGSPTTASSQINKNQNKKDNNDVKVEQKVKTENISVKENAKPQIKQSPKTTAKPARLTTTAQKPLFTRRPVAIGSPNKADLIASGSAVNENVMNKIKASVLANVQKNKNAALNRTTSTSTTTTVKPSLTTITVPNKNNEPSSTVAPVLLTTKKQDVKKEQNKAPSSTTEIVLKINKPPQNKTPQNKTSQNKTSHNKTPQNKVPQNKVKKVTTEAPAVRVVANSIESKQTEFELEVSTPPPSTTKKPKRKNSTKRKRNKNRRRNKVSTTVKPELLAVAESKISTNNNNSKVASKVPAKEKPITTQIYNYLSREVMPSVGVGLVSIAGLVGLASYFLYPFSGVVRRAYDTNERKDDLYYQNAENYASDDGGQSEEEMLGKVLAGMPDNNRNLDPYITQQSQFRYPQVKPQQEQNLRYRNVAYGSEVNSYLPSDRVGQQSPDNVQGATYSEQIHYDTHVPDAKDMYSQQFYQQPQPVYKAPEQMVHDSGYMPDLTYSSHEKIADPVYGQSIRYSQDVYAETTKTPVMETLHLGVDDVIEKQKETGYTVAAVDEGKEPQFVVGNVPKELIQAVTPVTVPEHGPRSLRIRRSPEANQPKRSVTDDIEKALREERLNVTDPDILNEIDEALGSSVSKHPKKPTYDVDKKMEKQDIKATTKLPLIVSDQKKETVFTVLPTTIKDEKISSISISEIGSLLTTKKYEASQKLPETTTTESPKKDIEMLSTLNEIIDSLEKDNSKTTKSPIKPIPLFIDVSTEDGKDVEELTTEKEFEITEIPPYPDTDSYPDTNPVDQPSKPSTFVGFLKNLIEFKLRLGMSLLQTTTESIARYLRGFEKNLRNAARASEFTQH